MAEGTRGPYRKTAERRREIGLAALEVVNEAGHPALTIASVAARAGLAEATVTYHFPTRDHLLVAALETWESPGTSAADGAFGRPGEPLAEAAERQARVDATQVNRLRLFAAMSAAAADPTHPANAWFLAHHRRLRRAFAAAVLRMQAEGEAHPDLDPERVARQMAGVWDGLQAQWLSDPTFDLADEVAAAFRGLTRQDAMAAKRAIEHLASTI